MATLDNVESTLECPICLNLPEKPKLLSCSHTFCEQCLSTLNTAQSGRDDVCCPLCRKVSSVPEGDVSKLGTNHVVQSLIDNLRAKVYSCTTCTEKKLAVKFCTNCDKFMCESCQQKHDEWPVFVDHERFSMEDVIAGKTRSKKKEKCDRRNHKQEIKYLWCQECKKYICPQCRIVNHILHGIIEAENYEKGRKEEIETLIDRVEAKKKYLCQHTSFVRERQLQVKEALQVPIKKIEAAHDEAIRRLKERRDSLISKCKEHEQLINGRLKSMVGENDMQTACIESAGELVRNGMRGRLEGDALTAHETLCQELEKLLEGCEVDYQEVENLSRRAAGLEFKRDDDGGNVQLGSLEHKTSWELGAETFLTKKNSMNGMAATPGGMMAVGCSKGNGIEIFSADGQLQHTVLKDVRVRNLGFLSDGRYVVLDNTHKMSLCTSECKKLDVMLETLSHEEGGIGNITVDSVDQIYVSYRKAKKIQVFTPAGGKAVREILCDGYQPWQIFAMKSSKRLVVKGFKNSVGVIDESGEKKRTIITDGNIYNVCPCVNHDGSILIAWVKYKEGLVSIDQYTDELQHVQTLITDHKIEKPERHWYYLQEFLSGEIAFCTPDKLYVFQQSVAPTDL